MWWHLILKEIYPQFKTNLVHPGIVPSGLGNSSDSIFIKLASKLLIDFEIGAQTTLYCATQWDIEDGAYYHNTLGKVILPKDDIALDRRSAEKFWVTLEDIYNCYVEGER